MGEIASLPVNELWRAETTPFLEGTEEGTTIPPTRQCVGQGRFPTGLTPSVGCPPHDVIWVPHLKH